MYEEHCALCGKVIQSKDLSYDHYIPRAVYKWSRCDLDMDKYWDLRNAICSKRNMIHVHVACNRLKADSIVPLGNLHLRRDQMTSIRFLNKKYREYVNDFLFVKVNLKTRQNDKCYICGCDLNDSGIIRRKNNHYKRTLDNACLVCHACNRQMDSSYRSLA